MTGAKKEAEQKQKDSKCKQQTQQEKQRSMKTQIRIKDWHTDEAQGQQNRLTMERITTVFAYFVDTKRETLT